ncbi:MAG: NAD(+)--rifampin ADP-ribosyltransferase [Bacteroidota bacterium]
MEFNPTSSPVQRCLQGMGMEEKGNPEEAGKLFMQAWNEATNDFEKFLAAYFVARHQKSVSDKLAWLQTSLQCALIVNNATVKAAISTLHLGIAECYKALNDPDNAKRHYDAGISLKDQISDPGPFYHGTKADLQVGDFLTAGYRSNYQSDIIMNHIYFTASVNGAGLAAALAKGDGPQRVYAVEPTGSFENDPNVTDKKFPGNLTRSYRTQAPLKIVAEIPDWARQMPEDVQKWQEKLANSKGEIIN